MRRLIAKTEEVVEKDLLIQEKDKLYVELKNILARQPGPEVAEQLSIYQQELRDKTKSMKAMASELNMYQAQINESNSNPNPSPNPNPNSNPNPNPNPNPNMYQAQINESKYEMERVTRELQDVKRKYYEQKRRETLAKEREALRGQEGNEEANQEQLTVQSM